MTFKALFPYLTLHNSRRVREIGDETIDNIRKKGNKHIRITTINKVAQSSGGDITDTSRLLLVHQREQLDKRVMREFILKIRTEQC